MSATLKMLRRKVFPLFCHFGFSMEKKLKKNQNQKHFENCETTMSGIRDDSTCNSAVGRIRILRVGFFEIIDLVHLRKFCLKCTGIK